MTQIPNLHQAEAIPEAAWEEVHALLQSADLFRYTAPKNAPVSRLEKAFAEKMSVKYALAVSSCSAALFLTMKAMGLKRDAKVLIPAFTFAAVPSAVIHADCQPILVDVAENYRIDIEDFKRKLPTADAVLISHMRGHTSDMDQILELTEQAGLPLIEDAAHSLGTLWNGRKIGTLGKVGCFSFQSYKMLNAGEGGILISNDADLMAQAVIMSGAYEHNWKKHPMLQDAFAKWQNRLPLYNTRMSNLSAAVILPQLDALEDRCARGLLNYEFMADILNENPYLNVPSALPQERRAPDSIQFNLLDFDDNLALDFVSELNKKNLGAQIFGLSSDNARAFWNWEFIGPQGPLPKTKDMLMRACDVRLPTRLSLDEVRTIADVIIRVVDRLKSKDKEAA